MCLSRQCFIKRLFIPALVFIHTASLSTVVIKSRFSRVFTASFETVGEYLVHHAFAKPRRRVKILFVNGKLISRRRFGIGTADTSSALSLRAIIHDLVIGIDSKIVPVDPRLRRRSKACTPIAVIRRHQDILMKAIACQANINAADLTETCFETQCKRLSLHHRARRISIAMHSRVVHHFVSVIDQHRIPSPFALIFAAAILACCIRQSSCLR